MRKHFEPWLLGLVIVGLVAAGCSSDDSSSASHAPPTTAASKLLTGSIRVSDAASLTEAFEQIGPDFTTANPKTSVTFNPGSSSTLATQIQQTNGVGIDTFASADEANMDKLVEREPRRRHPGRVRPQPAGHRDEAREPEEREVAGRPRRP